MVRELLTLGSVLYAAAAFSQSVDVARGEKLFVNQCSRCHGIGGTGGEGPNLARPTLRHAADDDGLFKVIRDGIDGTNMPDAWQLSDAEVSDVVGYVRSLGRVAAAVVPGDPARGKLLFEGKGGCSACHMVRGEGGILGPDLSEVGLVRGVAHLRESIRAPTAKLPEGYLLIRAVTADGQEIRGLRLNEDSFTIQLRDDSGRFHSLQKNGLRRLDRRIGESAMPSYEGKFAPSELDDLIAYLAGLRGAP